MHIHSIPNQNEDAEFKMCSRLVAFNFVQVLRSVSSSCIFVLFVTKSHVNNLLENARYKIYFYEKISTSFIHSSIRVLFSNHIKLEEADQGFSISFQA